MPRLPARAAAVRGDDFQYLVGFSAAVDAMLDSDAVSVSIEDADGGYFDDVVTRRRTTLDDYVQVKSSNYGNVLVNEAWLTTAATPKGRSPLQHFYDTWKNVEAGGRPFELSLLTVRGFDPEHPILSSSRDLVSNQGDVDALRSSGPGSALGRARAAWTSHLSCSVDDLAAFLSSVRWIHTGGEREWKANVRVRMLAAGLRNDDDALAVGIDMVRKWVTTGAGPQTTDDIRRQVAERNLLARSGVLTLAVHGIDHLDTTIDPPNFTIDMVARYDGDDPSDRYQLRDPSEWQTVVAPAIRDAARTLESFQARTVHVTGAMRLPMHFAVGRALPEVRGWVLTADQNATVWSTDATPNSDVKVRILHETTIGAGPDLVVAVALARDLTAAMKDYVQSAAIPAAKIIVLGPDGEPGNRSVPDAHWLTAWVQSARNEVSKQMRQLGAHRIHLFLSAPAVAAMMLGHQWNGLPPTALYEFDRYDYFRALELR